MRDMRRSLALSAPAFTDEARSTVRLATQDPQPPPPRPRAVRRRARSSDDGAPIGESIDGLRIGALLGRGASCLVLEVTRERDQQEGVIKLLRVEHRRDALYRAAVLREAEVLRACETPGIPALLGAGTLPDGSPYVAMERVHGQSLTRLVAQLGRLDPVRATRLIQRAAGIVSKLHAAGYVHADLKPDHVIVSHGFEVHIVDFGNARRIGELDPTPGLVIGTPHYMAPEQAEAVPDLDARADVYALGAMLYELLAGRRMFAGSDAIRVLTRLVAETPAPLALVAPDVELRLARVVQVAIERERERRFRSAAALAVALVPFGRSPIDRVVAEIRTVELEEFARAA